MAHRATVTWFFILFVVIGVVLWSHHGHNREPMLVGSSNSVPLSVLVQPIYRENFIINKDFIGHVEAYQGQTIYPMINGFVQEILVDSGDMVSVGQVLFVLNQDMYRAKVAQAEANVLQAQADMDSANLYLKRIQHTPSEAVSENLLDNAESSYKSAQAAYLAALGALEQARVELGYTVLRSELDGILGNISVSLGDFVSPQTNLGYILQTSPIKVAFSVPAKDYINPQFFDGYDVQILLPDGSVYAGQSAVLLIDNQFNRATNSAVVYVLVENHQAILLPDSTVTVRLKKEFQHEILVPQTAVSRSVDENSIYVLRDGVITQIPVVIQGNVKDQYYVSGDLDVHDQLIVQKISTADIGKQAHGVLK